MPRAALWTSIRQALGQEIASGHYRAGDKLPTEAQLSERFGVNRHTVRRALGDLQEAGQVYARRGAGVFVSHTPTDYPLGRRMRFHQNISATGRTPSRRLVLLETRAADPREAEGLGLAPGSPVHVCEGISLVDEVPMAVFRSVFPAQPFPRLLEHLRVDNSVTAAFRAEGLQDYTRASTRINAKTASPMLARQLQINPGEPILRTISINVDSDAVPVEYGRTWFAGDRVTITMAQEQGQGA